MIITFYLKDHVLDDSTLLFNLVSNTTDRILLIFHQWYVDLEAEKIRTRMTRMPWWHTSAQLFILIIYGNRVYTSSNMWSISCEGLCCKQDGGRPLNSRHPKYRAWACFDTITTFLNLHNTNEQTAMKSDILGLFQIRLKLG